MEEVVKMLQDIQCQMMIQKQEFKEMAKDISNEIIVNINEKLLLMEGKCTFLEQKLEEQQKCLNHLEGIVKRKNLIFFGLKEEEKSYQQLIEIIINLINSKMCINSVNNDIEYVKRLGKYNNNTARPVLVTFTTVSKKIEILRKKKLLSGTNYYIQQDFPKNILAKRKELQEQLLQERGKGNNAIIKYNKIVVLENKSTDAKSDNNNITATSEIATQKHSKTQIKNKKKQR